MMTMSIFIGVAVLLVLLLLLLTRSEDGEESASAEGADRIRRESRDTLQPWEIILRIFSREDREFILRMRSPRMLRIYQEERRRVALHWVRRTSCEVGEIMRTHRLASRQSENLDGAREAKLLFQYLRLQFVCGLLAFLIRMFGPHALSDLASYTGELYQRLGRALPDGGVASHLATTEDTATR